MALLVIIGNFTNIIFRKIIELRNLNFYIVPKTVKNLDFSHGVAHITFKILLIFGKTRAWVRILTIGCRLLTTNAIILISRHIQGILVLNMI